MGQSPKARKEKVRCTECGCILINPQNKEKKLCADHGGTKSMVESLPRGFRRM
jgi:hypothetical protein